MILQKAEENASLFSAPRCPFCTRNSWSAQRRMRSRKGMLLTAESLTVQSRIARALGEKQQAKDAVARVEEVALGLDNGKLL